LLSPSSIPQVLSPHMYEGLLFKTNGFATNPEFSGKANEYVFVIPIISFVSKSSAEKLGGLFVLSS